MQLHALLPIVIAIKNRNYKEITEISKLFQKPNLFVGHVRTYEKLNDKDESFPEESLVVQANAKEYIERASLLLTETWDALATRATANRNAVADVVVDGEVLVKDAPATWLLEMEKQVNDLRKLVELIPTLDTVNVWTEDGNSGQYRSKEVRTHKTKKVEKVVTLLPQTEHQQGQAQILYEDKTVGYWLQTNLSSAIPPVDKKEMLAKVNRLADAIKAARMKANLAPAPEQKVAKVLLDYIFA